jgi:hypothetical protein
LVYSLRGTSVNSISKMGRSAALTKLVPIPHVLFGTGNPFVAAGTVAKGLSDYGFSANDLHAIERGNDVALFPKYKNT